MCSPPPGSGFRVVFASHVYAAALGNRLAESCVACSQPNPPKASSITRAQMNVDAPTCICGDHCKAGTRANDQQDFWVSPLLYSAKRGRCPPPVTRDVSLYLSVTSVWERTERLMQSTTRVE